MIDRIFWLWQMMPGHSLPSYLNNEMLDPFGLTVRQVLDIYQLGYVYSIQQPANVTDNLFTEVIAKPIINSESQVVHTNTRDIFVNLGPVDRKYMKAVEESMLKHLESWTALYPHTSDSSDIFVNQKRKQKLDEIARLMCRDFNTIVEFMKRSTLKVDISDNYPGVQDICRSLSQLTLVS